MQKFIEGVGVHDFKKRLLAGENFNDHLIVRPEFVRGELVYDQLVLTSAEEVEILPRHLILTCDLILQGLTRWPKFPDGLHVSSVLYFRSCKFTSGIKPDKVDAFVICDEMIEATMDYVSVRSNLPEAVIAKLPGMRLGDVVDHYILHVAGVADCEIKKAKNGGGRAFIDHSGHVRVSMVVVSI
jgi:hypothetical protein